MEPFPDFASMSDDELREQIHKLTEEEHEVSYRRRLLHGRIDMLKAELVSRLQQHVGKGESPFSEVDVEKLTEILASRAAPPIPEER